MNTIFTEIMTQAQLDTDKRIVVITGSGRGFCAISDTLQPTENDRHIPTWFPRSRETSGTRKSTVRPAPGVLAGVIRSI